MRQLYLDSMLRFPNMTSPYLYTLYGLGELPQAFARLAAVHGGTYMLNRDLEGEPVFGPGDLTIEYEDKVAVGIKVKDVVAKTKVVIADPSYFPQLCKPTGKVVRAIALLDTPIAGADPAAESFQVIFPAGQVARTNDLYLFCCGAGHKVAPMGRFVAFLSSTVEGSSEGMTAQQVASRELAAGLQMLSGAKRIFFDMYDTMSPAGPGVDDKARARPPPSEGLKALSRRGGQLAPRHTRGWPEPSPVRPCAPRDAGLPLRVVRRDHALRDCDQRRDGHVQAHRGRRPRPHGRAAAVRRCRA